jgi:hypothetical protein
LGLRLWKIADSSSLIKGFSEKDTAKLKHQQAIGAGRAGFDVGKQLLASLKAYTSQFRCSTGWY